MNKIACERTSRWVNGTAGNNDIKRDLDDSKDTWDAADAPLDFSSKKATPPVESVMDDDADSNSGSSQRSRVDSPPASMAFPHNLSKPMNLPMSPLETLFPNFSTQKLPSFPFTNIHHTGKPVKQVRPFKAYPKDSLSLPLGFFGMPMNFGLLDAVNNHQQFFGATEDSMLQYKRTAEAFCAAGNAKKFLAASSPAGKPIRTGRRSSSGLVSSSNSGRPKKSTVTTPIEAAAPVRSPPAVADSTGVALSGSPQSLTRSESKSPGRGDDCESKQKSGSLGVPEEVKDAAYWERRRKNNEAAKRSRDSRRAKEDEIAMKATFLEQENLRLRLEKKQLQAEIMKMRSIVYATAQSAQ